MFSIHPIALLVEILYPLARPYISSQDFTLLVKT